MSLSVCQVINFTMPSTVKHYVHRVGRTARAGRSGRSVSLVGESERKMLKEVVKSAKNSVKARVLPPGTRTEGESCQCVQEIVQFRNMKELLVNLLLPVCVCHPEVILKFRDLITKLEKDVDAVVRLEKEERELAASEAKVRLTHLHTLLT